MKKLGFISFCFFFNNVVSASTPGGIPYTFLKSDTMRTHNLENFVPLQFASLLGGKAVALLVKDSPTDKILAVSLHDQSIIWELNLNRLLPPQTKFMKFEQMRVSPDGSVIGIRGCGTNIVFIDAASGNVISESKTNNHPDILSALFGAQNYGVVDFQFISNNEVLLAVKSGLSGAEVHLLVYKILEDSPQMIDNPATESIKKPDVILDQYLNPDDNLTPPSKIADLTPLFVRNINLLTTISPTQEKIFEMYFSYSNPDQQSLDGNGLLLVKITIKNTSGTWFIKTLSSQYDSKSLNGMNSAFLLRSTIKDIFDITPDKLAIVQRRPNNGLPRAEPALQLVIFNPYDRQQSVRGPTRINLPLSFIPKKVKFFPETPDIILISESAGDPAIAPRVLIVNYQSGLILQEFNIPTSNDHHEFLDAVFSPIQKRMAILSGHCLTVLETLTGLNPTAHSAVTPGN